MKLDIIFDSTMNSYSYMQCVCKYVICCLQNGIQIQRKNKILRKVLAHFTCLRCQWVQM